MHFKLHALYNIGDFIAHRSTCTVPVITLLEVTVQLVCLLLVCLFACLFVCLFVSRSCTIVWSLGKPSPLTTDGSCIPGLLSS